jgi:hypothetical protein
VFTKKTFKVRGREDFDRGRCVGADDARRHFPRIAEAVRQAAVEVVGVARTEPPGPAGDGQLELAFDDHAPFLTGMREQVLAGIAVGLVRFPQDRHLAVTARRRHQAVADGARAHVRQLGGAEHHVVVRLHVAREELGHRHREAAEDLLQGAHRRTDPALLDQGDHAVGHAGTLGQFPLAQAKGRAYRAQLPADIDAHWRNPEKSVRKRSCSI